MKNPINLEIASKISTKFVKRASKKIGLAPGSLVYTGRKKVDNIKIELIDYDEKKLTQKVLKNVEESFPFKKIPTTTWLNINGLHEISNIEKAGEYFGLHPLVQEDLLNTGKRPSFDDYDDYISISLKMIKYNEETSEVEAEHLSIIIGNNYVLTFQEKEGDVFDPLRERIKLGKPRLRTGGSEYLGYAIIDIVVDNYFLALEKIGDRIQIMEEEINNNPNKEVLNSVHALKRELIFLRKAIWPLRELVGKIEKSESKLITKKTKPFFRDVYDHSIQVIDTVESYRDMVSSLQDLYLSQVSNRMNEVMKVLTIFAAIFIPLTFVAGVYGMNFEVIPELKWPFGYFAVWIVFLVVGFGMLLYFKKKKWL